MNNTLHAHMVSFTSLTQVTVTFPCMCSLKSLNTIYEYNLSSTPFSGTNMNLENEFYDSNHYVYWDLFQQRQLSSTSLLPFHTFISIVWVLYFRLHTFHKDPADSIEPHQAYETF